MNKPVDPIVRKVLDDLYPSGAVKVARDLQVAFTGMTTSMKSAGEVLRRLGKHR
ncbi:hypothetical protein [Deinococcus hopiensis]|uniref:Uncharacterized protein n=1 Tax=Deinococcus hopiensis KR-140 TaxID=695939 RepID=A0A1W1V6W5_9DEIO|nr:hypothetical protein [Deinococcus hopiensis]SMB89169.1 hypothetical protein SAMN00790413_00292 [Deinococcus hopiensis KR-140]